MKNAKYKIGEAVMYRGNFGSGPIKTATIIGMDDEEKGELVYDLTDGHWCYEDQIFGRAKEEV